MSQNLIGVAKCYQGQYYVFPETAEEVVGDERENGEKIRYLEITGGMTLGPYSTLEEALQKAENDFYDGYFEYGIMSGDYLDDIKLVLTYKGEEVESEEGLCDCEDSTMDQRFQVIEDFMDTQSKINVKMYDELRYIRRLLEQGSVREMKGEGNSTDYSVTAICKGLVFSDLSKKFSDYHWDVSRGKYTIVDWFGIRPMEPRFIDGKELTKKDTLHDLLPLMTYKQAWRFIKENRKALELYFRKG